MALNVEKITIKHEFDKLKCAYPTRVTVLPNNLSSIDNIDDVIFDSEASTLKTILQNSEEINYQDAFAGNKKVLLNQDNSIAFPAIFIPLSQIIDNPHIVSIILGMVSNYLTDFFKGKAPETEVELKIIVEQDENHKCVSISYKGTADTVQNIDNIVENIMEAK